MQGDHELVPNYTMSEVPLQDLSFYIDKRWMSPEEELEVMTINGQSIKVSVVKCSSIILFCHGDDKWEPVIFFLGPIFEIASFASLEDLALHRYLGYKVKMSS